MVQRMVGAEAVSAIALAHEVGVSQNSLSRWLREARSLCVFRSISIPRFARSRSPISAEVDHPFRSKPITDFCGSRSGISLQADHPYAPEGDHRDRYMS
jgi:hypothetical protein